MTVILPNKARDARKKERDLTPVRPGRKQRADYLAALRDQVSYLKAQTANLSKVVQSGANALTAARALQTLSQQATERVNALAPNVAQSFVSSVDQANKQATEAAIARSLSVDFARILDGPGIAEAVSLALTENVSLIKSITSEHLDKVAQAVLDNYRGVPLTNGDTLAGRLQALGGITDRRAQFIARDQTASLSSALNSVRQQENGIDEYTWHNSRDNRVVGNPGGKYPKGNQAHGNHWDREGKTYSWSSPPHDGHPGQAIGCRCIAKPKLNLDKLKAQYV